VRVALDTNILVYAETTQDMDRSATVRAVLSGLRPHTLCVGVQVLGELFSVLVRKGRWARDDAKQRVLAWSATARVLDSSASAMIDALEIAARNRLQIWDALLLAVAVEAGCEVLLSEGLQHGYQAGGMLIVNPFVTPPHPAVAALLERS
jgi:predicted nucleic acid-binding protein